MPTEVIKTTDRSGKTIYLAKVRIRKNKKGRPPFSRVATERFTIKSLAAKWCINQENAFLEEYENILLGKPPKPVVADITLHDYIQAILDYMPSVPVDDRFSDNYLSCLRKWQKMDIAQLKSSEITDQSLVDHLEERITCDGVTPATNSSDLAALEKAMKWQKRMKLHFQPFITQELREELSEMSLIGKSKQKDRRPGTEEFLTLYEYFSRRFLDPRATINYPCLMLFAVYSSFRISEICRLKWSLYNEETGEIIITDRKHPSEKKGNDEKIILNDQCRQILALVKPQSGEDRIFPCKSSSVCTKFSSVTKQFKMKGLSFHCLRHEAVSRMFELGFTIPQVTIFSGHKKWDNLKRYTHLTQKTPPDLLGLCLDIDKKVKEEFVQSL